MPWSVSKPAPTPITVLFIWNKPCAKNEILRNQNFQRTYLNNEALQNKSWLEGEKIARRKVAFPLCQGGGERLVALLFAKVVFVLQRFLSYPKFSYEFIYLIFLISARRSPEKCHTTWRAVERGGGCDERLKTVEEHGGRWIPPHIYHFPRESRTQRTAKQKDATSWWDYPTVSKQEIKNNNKKSIALSFYFIYHLLII